MKKIICQLIHIYQATRAIRPMSCRFEPSCSDYAEQAIEKYGVFKGSLMAFKRILRCNPWNKKHGYDPVP